MFSKHFKIQTFITDQPIHITNLDGMYLSSPASKTNRIVFVRNHFNADTQRWIIERDPIEEDIFYIKNVFKRFHGANYLGAPNKSGEVFLYTSKNKYTKWKIFHERDDIYNIEYSGEKFNPQEVCLVIARYNEMIEWVLAYNDIAIVYNKGKRCDMPFQNLKPLTNIGREGHTYLYHIIENYNNFSKKTIFCQGDPFIHNSLILFGIDNHDKTLDVQPLGFTYIPNRPIVINPIKNTIDTDYGLIYRVFVMDQHMNCIEHEGGSALGLNTTYKNRFPEAKSLVENFLERSNYPVTKQVHEIRFTLCGLFSVTDEKIKNHDISVYKGLLKELTSFDDQSGVNGYILEKMWLYIFEDE